MNEKTIEARKRMSEHQRERFLDKIRERNQNFKVEVPDEDDTCNNCGGTGEGMYEGSKCTVCKGRGEI